jgi:hypothetical protein
VQRLYAIGSASQLQPPLLTNWRRNLSREDLFNASVSAAPSRGAGVAETQASRLSEERKQEVARRGTAGAVEDLALLSALFFWGLIHAAFLLPH